MMYGRLTRRSVLKGGTAGFPPEIFGTLDGTRGLDVTRAYVRAFFDRHLSGRGGQLVERPSTQFPEVTFRG